MPSHVLACAKFRILQQGVQRLQCNEHASLHQVVSCMQVIAGAVVGSALGIVWYWVVLRWLAEAVLPAVQQWQIVKSLGFKDVWRENPDEILYKEREWYELRGARKKVK